MTLVGRQVVYAKLQEGAFLPKTGNFGDTLPPSMKNLDVKMFHQEEGLFIAVNGEEALVPWPNVKIVKYAPEAVAKTYEIKAVA